VECGKWLEELAQGTVCSLKEACDEVRASKECVLAAVRQNSWQSLKHAPQLQDDDDVALAAVRTDGLALVVVSARLRNKPQVALAAIARDRESMAYLREPLRSDREFLRRAYWVSTLDCAASQRLKKEELGLFETWEDILFKQCSSLGKMFWECLHQELRKRSFTLNIMSSVMPVVFPAFITIFSSTQPSQYSWWQVFLALWGPMFAIWILLAPVFNEMHVDFVKWIAGPLENPRRFCCRCCERCW
jgi:hypothetical protein